MMAKKPVRGARAATSKAKAAFKPCKGCKAPAKCKKAGKCLAKK
jgi:hypothetical protein